MPTESQQREANLEQPWKEWHSELNPTSRTDVAEGSLVLKQGDDDSGNHGTTALDQKHVDLASPKQAVVTEVC